MIGATLLLRDVVPDKWWPVRGYAHDPADLVTVGLVTAEAIRRTYGDLLRDPRWQQKLSREAE